MDKNMKEKNCFFAFNFVCIISFAISFHLRVKFPQDFCFAFAP